MNSVSVDLYSYFKLDREQANGGVLKILENDACKQRPAALIFAGGGYRHVSKREQLPVAKEFIKRGFRAFLIDYSVLVSHPTPVLEAALAMLYLRKNAKRLGIIESEIVGVGFSAGGHLLGCLGILFDGFYKQCCFSNLDKLGFSDIHRLVRPDAMILCYPVVTACKDNVHLESFKIISGGDNRLFDSLSLEKGMNQYAVPAFIWHTANDGSVTAYNSLVLALAYEKFKIPFSLQIYARGRHGLSVATSEVVDDEDLNNATSNVSGWIEQGMVFLNDLGLALN